MDSNKPKIDLNQPISKICELLHIKPDPVLISMTKPLKTNKPINRLIFKHKEYKALQGCIASER